jgi:peroxiredoxin
MNNKILSIVLFLGISLSLSAQLSPGDKAVNFTLKNVDTEMVTLFDYLDNKGVILVFTCNPCPFSKAYEQRIIKIHNFYAPKGYPVLAINSNDENRSPDDTFEKMQQLAEEKEYPFPYLKDDQEIFRIYGATRTPHIYLLNKNNNGVLKVAYIGAIDNNAMDPKDVTERYLENAIARLEKGEKPDPAVVKAIGCTIKAKKK